MDIPEENLRLELTFRSACRQVMDDVEAREWLLGFVEAAYGLIDTLTVNSPAHENMEDRELLEEKIEELEAFLPVRREP